MEGQGHIFRFDLIFLWVNMPCDAVMHSVNGIFLYHLYKSIDCDNTLFLKTGISGFMH